MQSWMVVECDVSTSPSSHSLSLFSTEFDSIPPNSQPLFPLCSTIIPSPEIPSGIIIRITCPVDSFFSSFYPSSRLHLPHLMEAAGIEEVLKAENHGSSAADFVEGGLQEACDDACSICLENYTASDPSTVTNCKHEFHLQCILEWGQRSSQCPMCWQSLRLKDPTSQELFEAVEQERNIRMVPPRNTMIFRHPTFGDFELQNLPAGTNIHELEERIIQHLTAAAAVGRARHMARRESHRSRSHSSRPQFMAGFPHPDASSADHFVQAEGDAEVAASTLESPYRSLPSTAEESPRQRHDVQNSLRGEQLSSSTPSHSRNARVNINHSSPHSPSHNDSAGPSDLHSFSENLKSRFNAISMRYKESMSKNARGWKERLFSRNPQTSEIASGRDLNAGMATGSGGSSPDHHDLNTSRAPE